MQQKKYRNKEGLFIAEGAKVIGELLSQGLVIHSHYHTNPQAYDSGIQEISEVLLQKISCLKTANTSLATFKIPAPKPPVCLIQKTLIGPKVVAEGLP